MKIFIFFMCIFLAAAGISLKKEALENSIVKVTPPFSRVLPAENLKKLSEKLQKTVVGLQKFAAKHHYNDSVFFIADMSISAGRKRYFVYNANSDSILAAGLVTHGQGNGVGSTIQYSNEPGSNCTSDGIYKIGNSYSGRFGLAYKLYGLQTTNSNALNRFVVLHAHSCVPDEEVYPEGICMSQGCPTVSPAFLNVLDRYLKKPGKKILLEILR